MLPLYHFVEDRIICSFHLEGVGIGRRVTVFKIDPQTGERFGLLATATVGEGGWVNLDKPIPVRGGDVFVDLMRNTRRTQDRRQNEVGL